MAKREKPQLNRYEELTDEFMIEIMKHAGTLFRDQLDELPSCGAKSPIEELLGAALYFAVTSPDWFGGHGWGEWGDNWPYTGCHPADVLTMVPDRDGIFIGYQVPVGKYTADFLLCSAHFNGGYVRGAIECDGHDHHNLTKEQAKHDRERDRYFQSQGLIILRYTGSEIWKAPLKCAVDAITILQDRAKDPSAARYRDPPGHV